MKPLFAHFKAYGCILFWCLTLTLSVFHSPAFGDLNNITIETGFSGKISYADEAGLFFAGVNSIGNGEGLLWSQRHQDAFRTSATLNGSHLTIHVEKIGYIITAQITTGLTALDGTWNDPNDPDVLNRNIFGGFVNNRTILPEYLGELTGTYNGDSSGAWSAIVFQTGYAEGDLFYNDQPYILEGGIDPGGELVMVARLSQQEQLAFRGKIRLLSGSGRTASGTWTNSHSARGGSFTGVSDDASGVPSDVGGSSGAGVSGDSGGGCFIANLLR